MHIFENMKQTLSLLLLFFLLPASLLAETGRLERWQVSRDGEQWEEVSVPHSTNAIDGRSASYYRGETHYRCEISPDLSKTSFLFFDFLFSKQLRRVVPLRSVRQHRYHCLPRSEFFCQPDRSSNIRPTRDAACQPFFPG